MTLKLSEIQWVKCAHVSAFSKRLLLHPTTPTLCVQEVFNLKKYSLLVTGRNLEQSDS